MTTIAIMISTENGGIGINGKLPWFQISILNDSYEELATDQIVLVGSLSFASQEHLRGAVTYVYTQNESFEETETIKRVSGDPETVLNTIREAHPDKNIIIAGGKTVFEKFYNLIDEWRITIIEEFVVYNEDINLTDIQFNWPNKKLINSGQDLNQNFSTYHFTK